MKPKIAITIGDMNGVGPQIALAAHDRIKAWCDPVYCVDKEMIRRAAQRLEADVPEDFRCVGVGEPFALRPGEVSEKSGLYSFHSFEKGVELAQTDGYAGVVTLPVHKLAWHKAGLPFAGHTQALAKIFNRDAVMMLGCDKMFVALFTEHIPLEQVPERIKAKKLMAFLEVLDRELPAGEIGVLGLNPHAGDGGVLGDEEEKIVKAIKKVNKALEKERFVGPLVPDTAFTPAARNRFKMYAAMYHDQGLAPLKALYFDESINVTLNLPIVRTSVDHGTAFDIAYKGEANSLSYLNAMKAAVEFANQRS